MKTPCPSSNSNAPYPSRLSGRLAYHERFKTASSRHVCRYCLLDAFFTGIRVFIISYISHNVSSHLRLWVMAAFYHDGSRRSIFAERARQFGPINAPEMCQIDLLEWSPGTHTSAFDSSTSMNDAPFAILTCLTGDSATTQPLIQTDARAIPFGAQPRVQIVYVHPVHYSALLMEILHELCAFGQSQSQNSSWHSSNLGPLFHSLRLCLPAFTVRDAFLQFEL